MNFNQLRYFVAIVKHGSFWSAALEEYISQSSLSKQIKALETELGVVLFNRTGNKITLTEAGQCFYDYALQLLETKNEMHQELMAFEDTPIEDLTKQFLCIKAEFTLHFPHIFFCHMYCHSTICNSCYYLTK